MAAEADVPPIRTPRLVLVSMSVPFMEALARRDLDFAAREVNATVPAAMPDDLKNFLVLFDCASWPPTRQSDSGWDG